MSNKLERNKKLLTLIVSLIALIGIAYSTVLFIIDSSLEALSVETDAKILSLDYDGGNRYATVTYRVDKLDYVISTPIDESQEHLAINDTLRIKYDIRNPGKTIYNNHLIEILITVIISIILIIISLPKSLKIINEYKKLKKLKQTGLVVDADITDVVIETQKNKFRNKYPYCIRAKYTNPESNEEYTFVSECTYADLKEQLKETGKETIKVYIDKSNINHYFVDLDDLK